MPVEIQGQSPTDIMASPTTSRLMLLPAELRMRIWRNCLAPSGSLCLAASPGNRHRVTPKISTALLRTAKQIHSEASHLLVSANTVVLRIDVHRIFGETVPRALLPLQVLPTVEDMCIVLDCTGWTNLNYRDADFEVLKRLVALKRLRLVVVHYCAGMMSFADDGAGRAGGDHDVNGQADDGDGDEVVHKGLRELVKLMQVFLRCLPANVVLELGTVNCTDEARFVTDLIELQQGSFRPEQETLVDAERIAEVDVELLQRAVAIAEQKA